MSQEKRLSLSFGDFACDIVGYDDPFTILNRVMELFTEVSKTTSWVAGDSEKAQEVTRSRFAERITKTAASYDLHIDDLDGRFVVSKRDTAEVVITDDEADTNIVVAGDVDAQPEQAEVVAADAPQVETVVEAPAEAEDVVAEEPSEVVTPDEVVAEADDSDDVTPAATAAEDAPVAEEPAEEQPTKADLTDDAAAIVAAEETIETGSETETQQPETTEKVETVGERRERRRLRLSASAAPAMPGPQAADTQAEDSSDAPSEASEATVDAGTDAKPAEPRRPRIVIDKARSQPYRKPAAEAPMSGLRFSVTQKTSEDTVAEDHARGLKANFSSVNEDDALSALSGLAGQDPDEAPLILSTPAEADTPADEPALILSDPIVASKAKVTEDNDIEDDENLFVFEASELAPAAPAKPVRPQLVRTEPEVAPAATPEETPQIAASAPTIEPPHEAPKKKSFGFGLFRRNKQPAVQATPAGSADEAAFDRLRETARAALPELESPTRSRSAELPERQLFSVSGGETHEDASSPAAFARQVGASSLQDLLEASAAYMAIMEGKAKFSRREVMTALSEIGPEKDYSPEARLKSFRRLITLGAIVPSDDGMFTISHATRFGYENQLRA